MPTTPLLRADTRTISIAAPPATVLDVVADPTNLPRWAPAFARAVRPDGDDWIVDTGEGELRIQVRVSRELGTVDLLRPGQPETGAFTRTVRNGDGSEFAFTLFFPPGTPDEAVARQAEVVEEELRTVRVLAELRG
jgi:hypothetical protein